MKDKLFLDFETFSKVDIRKRGSMRYARDDSTQAICLGHAINKEPTELWTPAMEFPKSVIRHVLNRGLVYAHNAIFDYRIWNYVLTRDFEEVPQLDLKQCVDTAALCQTYTLPGSLAKAGEALQILLAKLEEGVRLINKCCCPDKNGNQPMYHENKQAFNELFMYCRRDVDAMREIVYTLPKQELLPVEQESWLLTAKMNSTGLPIDEESVYSICEYLENYVKEAMVQVSTITGGYASSVNQVAKIKAWCEMKGVDLPNLQAGTIKSALADERMPEQVAKILKLRQELGRTSTAKYKKIKELLYNGVVYDNLQYHGTSTGRWAGRGFQMHNLPRAKVKDPEEYIIKFKTKAKMDDPVSKGKALIRPMIKAPGDQLLIVSDYSSIENRILAWLANDEVTLQGFRDGFDQYIDMASTLYNVPYEEVTDAQRQMGKMIILGCGYGMGYHRFQESAAEWGVHITYQESVHAVGTYREKYYLIKEMWKDLQRACIRAIVTGKRQTYNKIIVGTSTVNDIRWLAMRMPSGKCIYYMKPHIEDHHIPGYEEMGKVPTVMHWGINPYSKKWSRLKVSPGRLTENATQGTAQQAMSTGLLNVDKNMPEISLIGTVHDEALGLINESLATNEKMIEFNKNLCDIPWAPDCPLKAKGYYSKRYKKD